MKIILNGKKENVQENITLMDLILSKNLNPDTIVVEYNLNIVKKEEWSNTFLKENDSIEVLRFVGGG
ncbi:sulfur carrier protein ThiS [Defluviitalea phaphyphila]|uniref:sulfur carrier protein ThiS n=1 Tax=Defluviitalea phaphyphila TaxID=1473580 RepID=UPI000730C27A|nr:sulfur carrier protein ThiS [Defluviitalea phaphyphila]